MTDDEPTGLRARLLRLPIPAPNLDRILERMDAKSPHVAPLTMAGTRAKPRQSFRSHLPMGETSFSRVHLAQIPMMLRVQGRLIVHMLRGSRRFYKERFVPASDTADEAFFAELEAKARDWGALDIAYVTDIPDDQIFQDKGIPHRNAIVFTVEMDQDEIAKAPSFETFIEVGRGYRNLADIGNRLTAFMRERGFAAYPGTALGGVTDYCVLGEMAGLGAIGYHGMLIAPDGGTRLRTSTVYTNITNLPASGTNPHTWIRDFCAKCRKCIRGCPPGAIYDEPRDAEWAGKSCIDYPACLDTFSRDWGCAVCVAVCPFSNAGYDKIKQGFDRAQSRALPIAGG